MALSFGRFPVSRGFLHFFLPSWKKKRHPVSLIYLSESADSIFLLFLICFLLSVGTAARFHLCASFIFSLVPRTKYLWMASYFESLRPQGFYYYSSEPNNSYYDSLKQPILLMKPQPLFALIAILFILLVGLDWLSFYVRKRKHPKTILPKKN